MVAVGMLKKFFIIIVSCMVVFIMYASTPQRGGSLNRNPQVNLELLIEGACKNSSFIDKISNNATIVSMCRDFYQNYTEYFRVKEEKVNPYIHNFTISGNSICDNDTDIIMIIHSLHNYTDRREAIRMTWGGSVQNGTWPGGTIPHKIKVAFIFGIHPVPRQNQLLLAESEEHEDIIQGTFQENYYNMTLKSLLGLKFVKEHCPSAKYLLKSDDDMVINFPYLENILTIELRNKSRYIMGPFCGHSPVSRNGRWAVPQEKYPFYFYPPYEAGSAYIITADLISDLFHTAEYVPPIDIDDVYITGILGKILDVTHIQHSGFAYWADNAPTAYALISNKIVTGTKMEPFLQVQLWKNLTNIVTQKDNGSGQNNSYFCVIVILMYYLHLMSNGV